MGCILKGGGGLYSRLVVGAVLLAAGSGSRMGNRPKSLLELGGVPLIRRQLIALSGAGVDELVVVLGHHAERIELAVRDFPVTVVRNPDPDAGQVSSLRLGLQALSPKIDTVLVALADQPLINSQDINDLIGAYKKRPAGAQVVQPTVDDQPGNPVMFSGEVREQILAGEARIGCKQWQSAHPEAVHRWASTNQRYRTDVDSPEDIEALATRTGHRLRWPTDLTEPA
ncbi:MAG TPA: nucleotidyltransferase family protein [Hydrogenophaga sp.]|uniref:nucleotidyltransferase family protein n=1 Tax=Hydrogenophaga sp. TaxID=1904254 RepID=UPI0008AB45F7|nr:nucleotidyltransferase family protein [Hydrogenophaga sp.]OGA73590.1 MAG: molybdenum cofactor cytidylyltransferase [Burkholderiales bacterium GWE1_65_30]OGA92084.1 MAG: molybdenum cofactor cytidylyltransferase [Burkholderiales bacterium GWF1_66_17]OGB13247.1 MAG: molybdenum cofactor cytidylyltransferase [Burkholderiales bacterium RIFCSPHIGHO2_02_FULL_66_10]OGB32083.1 MAG: molybdenum cofactor cytidylyltransferase [Burkholderiales bacterium RIFCSPLOWO2_02_FULL_66_35]MDZ4295258.1 nucleotidyltr